ncbi:hypothetical protein ACFYPN_30710 [Streptomyces sp. NPDC005576]
MERLYSNTRTAITITATCNHAGAAVASAALVNENIFAPSHSLD